MITDADRQALGDLAMRALDTITEDYGDDAELVTAVLVFEIRALDDDGDVAYHGNYKSLPRSSPHHIAGLMWMLARWLATGEDA